ncbi:hypothetical protein D3C71_742230 [compost metagenome]
MSIGWLALIKTGFGMGKKIMLIIPIWIPEIISSRCVPAIMTEFGTRKSNPLLYTLPHHSGVQFMPTFFMCLQ